MSFVDHIYDYCKDMVFWHWFNEMIWEWIDLMCPVYRRALLFILKTLWFRSIYRLCSTCIVLPTEVGGIKRNHLALDLEDGVLWWRVGGITIPSSDGGVVCQWRGETKWKINKTDGCGGLVADMQEEYSVVPFSQPHSFNLLTAISCFIGKRVLCASMPPTIAWSQKSDDSGEGGFGCFVIFYMRCVTLRGSSAPLCGSYLLYTAITYSRWEKGAIVVFFVFSVRSCPRFTFQVCARYNSYAVSTVMQFLFSVVMYKHTHTHIAIKTPVIRSLPWQRGLYS